MLHKGDQFEGVIYDSSYIIWVPIIQQRLRPWVKTFKEKKMLAEKERQENENKMLSSGRRDRGPITDELIIETGSLMVSDNRGGRFGRPAHEGQNQHSGRD